MKCTWPMEHQHQKQGPEKGKSRRRGRVQNSKTTQSPGLQILSNSLKTPNPHALSCSTTPVHLVSSSATHSAFTPTCFPSSWPCDCTATPPRAIPRPSTRHIHSNPSSNPTLNHTHETCRPSGLADASHHATVPTHPIAFTRNHHVTRSRKNPSQVCAKHKRLGQQSAHVPHASRTAEPERARSGKSTRPNLTACNAGRKLVTSMPRLPALQRSIPHPSAAPASLRL